MIIESVNIKSDIASASSDMTSSQQLNDPAVKEKMHREVKNEKFDIRKLNERMEELQQNLNLIHNVKLKFSVHKQSGRLMIIVSDEDSGRVIREIPPSQMLDIAAKLEDLMGVIFDQKG